MNECKEHKYRVQGEITDGDCPYCRIAELEQQITLQQPIYSRRQLLKRIAELEQQLADEKKAAGHWMEQSCKDHNRAEKLEQLLSRYQGEVEVEGVVVPYSDIVRWQGTIDLRLPEEMIGKQVRMLVKEVE